MRSETSAASSGPFDLDEVQQHHARGGLDAGFVEIVEVNVHLLSSEIPESFRELVDSNDIEIPDIGSVGMSEDLRPKRNAVAHVPAACLGQIPADQRARPRSHHRLELIVGNDDLRVNVEKPLDPHCAYRDSVAPVPDKRRRAPGSKRRPRRRAPLRFGADTRSAGSR